MDKAPLLQPTIVARLLTRKPTALRIVEILGARLDPERTALAAFETAGGWAVEIHFQDMPDETAVRALVAHAADAETAAALRFETITAVDWVRASLAGLAPVPAGRFLVHGAHDRARVAPNRIGIEIEAALAFGTGHHGTTRGCLEALDLLARTSRAESGHPRRILDIGTGSGVLAIAAARRLRRPVLASDIDARAVAAARENARINRVGALVAIVAAKNLALHVFRRRAPFDLVLANILLPTLKTLAGPAVRLAAPGGHIVLSGLLASHAAAAVAAYRTRHLVLVRRIEREGWVTLVMRRPARKCRGPAAGGGGGGGGPAE